MTALSLALAGSALLATAASAQITYTDGDLLLDFRATSGTGAPTDFTVDLGAADLSLYQSGTVNLTNVLTATEKTELSTLYSGNSNVVWSVTGANSGTLMDSQYANGDTVFVTQASGSSAPVLASNVVAASGQPALSTVGSGVDKSDTSATAVDAGSATLAANNSQSYSTELTATGGQYFSLPINSPETAYVAGGGATLTLFAIQPDAAADSANATDYKLANFTFAAVPEPSTYALMLGGLVALVAFKRRWLNRSV